MVQEHSAGGIVFKDNLVLLIRNYKPERGVDYWGFPKGHIEGDETEEEAAIREVKEETKINVKTVQKIVDNEYSAGFNDNNEEVWKKVSYFLMDYVSGEIVPQKGELKGANWVPVDQAGDKLTYENDRQILHQAKRLKNLV